MKMLQVMVELSAMCSRYHDAEPKHLRLVSSTGKTFKFAAIFAHSRGMAVVTNLAPALTTPAPKPNLKSTGYENLMGHISRISSMADTLALRLALRLDSSSC
jgi:hypothetical protein